MNRHTNQNLIITLYYCVKALPSVGAIFSIWVGYRLFVLGVGGTASLVVGAKDFTAQLTNATPGLFCIVVGLSILGVSAWRGTSVYSDVTGKQSTLMANEVAGTVQSAAQYPGAQSNRTKERTNASDTTDALRDGESVIGPHVPWDYKHGKPPDKKPDA